MNISRMDKTNRIPDEIHQDHNTFEISNLGYVIGQVILMVWICTGNGLILIAYARSEGLRTVTNFFILQLSIADFSVGILMPMHITMYLWPRILSNTHACLLRYCSLLVTMTTSVLCLLVMTIDRYIAIFSPLRYQTIMSKLRATIIIVTVWSYAFILAVIIPFIWYKHDWEFTEDHGCAMLAILHPELFQFIALPQFFLIASIIIFLYIKIFRLAYTQSKIMEKEFLVVNGLAKNGMKSVKKFKRDVSLSKTAVIVLGLFLGSWLPFIIILMLQVYGNMVNNNFLITLRGFATLLAICNSGMNPIIYASRMRDFRIEFKKILHIKQNQVDILRQTDSIGHVH